VTTSAEALAVTCAQAADERQADDIVVLAVGEITPIADFFVLATGRNVRQLRALARGIEDAAEEAGTEVQGVEGEPESGWVLVDTGPVVVHLFSADLREMYALEMLWGSCSTVEWQEEEPAENEG
jgi:ribosome-associated protein